MKLDDRLNLVIPMELNGSKIHVHSVPISLDVFEQFFDVLATAYNEVIKLGLNSPVSLRTARLWLRKTALNMGRAEEVQGGLINEIHRLTNVLVLGKQGWETVPFQQMIQGERFATEEVSEIENALIFFTFVSHLTERASRTGAQKGSAGVFGGVATSLNCTGYAASLPTLTAPVSSGETQHAPPAPPAPALRSVAY
jgi:hypothetical protein